VLLHTEPGKWFKSIPSDYLTFTDAQGWFTVYLPYAASGPIVPTVCRLPHGAEVWASLSPPGTRPPVETACERWDLGEIAISTPDGVITGEVRGANGKPEPFALVVAQGKEPPAPARKQEITCRVATCNEVRKTLRQQMGTASPFACTLTDAQGRFRLPVQSGEWQLRAHPTHAPREPAVASVPSLPCQIPFVSAETRWVTARVSRGQTVTVQLPLSAGGWVRPVRV
jgi:hypothetical protein